MGGRTAPLLFLLASVAACTSNPNPPTPSGSVTESPNLEASSAATAAPEQLEIEFHPISQDVTTPLLEVRTDGTQICWSAGPDATGNVAPDLYCYQPGGPAPAKVFANPNRDSNLGVIAVAGDWYAFAEQNERAFGVGGWRLWLLHGSGSPVEVDRSDGPGGMLTPPPTISLNDRWLVWATFHQDVEGPHSWLKALDLDIQEERTLDDGPFEEIQYWFPSLDEDRLAYGTVEGSASGEDWHVYLASMTAAWQPKKLDAGAAAQPVLKGDTVIWKHGGGAVFDWGSLTRHSIASGDEVSISFGPQPAVNYPSVGSRFVAVWGRDDTKLYLYDLDRDSIARVIELDPRSTTGYVRPTVSGRLLTVIMGSTDPNDAQDSDALQLLWAELPE